MLAQTIANGEGQQVKEEAVWVVTNLSMFSSQFQAEFEIVACAMIQVILLDKIDNLAALLNLK